MLQETAYEQLYRWAQSECVCSGPYTDTHTHTHTAEARSFWNISTVSVARECETEN